MSVNLKRLISDLYADLAYVGDMNNFIKRMLNDVYKCKHSLSFSYLFIPKYSINSSVGLFSTSGYSIHFHTYKRIRL